MKKINIDFVDSLTTTLTDLQDQIDGIGGGGGGSGFGNIYDTIADATGATYSTTPASIIVLGYYAAGDGGAAIYAYPTTTPQTRTDAIEIDVAGTPTWLLRYHDRGAVDLLQHGLKGDGTDESVAFASALSVAALTGLKKIVNRDATKTFKVVDVAITATIEIDLGGATLRGQWNHATAPNTTATILKSNVSSLVDIVLRNMTVDGMNGDPSFTPSGNGGHPLLFFNGGGLVELDRVILRRGGNRDNSIVASVLTDDNRGELNVRDARIVRIHDSKFQWSTGEVVQILYSGSNAFASTKVEIERCEFSKFREDTASNYWSSSHLVVYNCGKSSFLRDCVFGQTHKSAVNWFGPGTIENCRWEGVFDSQGFDFNETGKFNIDEITIRGCFFQNITNGYAIRGSGRNVIIEDCSINRCQNGIYIETWGGTSYPIFNGVGSQRIRAMYNVWIKNITSNGNDVVDGDGNAVANSLIKVKGSSPANPAFVYVSGLSPQVNSDFPSANPEYGIYTEDCHLFLEGAFMHGRTSLIWMTGYANLVARNCQFYPQPGATTNVITFSSASIRDIVIEDCQRWTALDAGQYDIQVSGSSISGKLYSTRSTLNQRSGTFTTVTNYGT